MDLCLCINCVHLTLHDLTIHTSKGPVISDLKLWWESGAASRMSFSLPYRNREQNRKVQTKSLHGGIQRLSAQKRMLCIQSLQGNRMNTKMSPQGCKQNRTRVAPCVSLLFFRRSYCGCLLIYNNNLVNLYSALSWTSLFDGA